MNTKSALTFTLVICILLTACQLPQMADIEVLSQIVEADELSNEELLDESEEDSSKEVNIGEMLIHWDDGTIQYGSRDKDDFLFLYKISNDGAEMTQIAAFQTFYAPGGPPPIVTSFSIVGDWIIFTFDGEHRFAGDFFRMKKDGSELGGIFIQWDDGDMQFGSTIADDSLVLYEIGSQGAEMTQIAAFPPFDAERGLPPSIFYFELVDDWIVLSVGEIQGSMRNFFGNIFRVSRDGSKRELFEFGWHNPRFIIINDWVYHNDWDLQGGGEGWLRVHADGTGKEFLDRAIATIAFFGDDGYIYGTHRAEEMGGWRHPVNFMRWQPDGDINDAITLFEGGTLPKCEDSGRIGFTDIVVGEDYITFTAFVWGYRHGDSWRGSLIYTAYYKVDKDGSNLVFLGKEQH